MSKVNPQKHEYETRDGLEVAKDVAWVIKTLWSGAVVFILATIWVVALANDVKSNTDDIKEKASAEQVAAVAKTLERMEKKMDRQAVEQKTVSDAVIRLETKVEAIEKRTE